MSDLYDVTKGPQTPPSGTQMTTINGLDKLVLHADTQASMAPKRSRVSSPITPSKKAKQPASQGKLEHFFTRSPSTSVSPSNSNGRRTQAEINEVQFATTREVIRRTTGVSTSSTSRLATTSISSAETRHVIDVDALDDLHPGSDTTRDEFVGGELHSVPSERLNYNGTAGPSRHPFVTLDRTPEAIRVQTGSRPPTYTSLATDPPTFSTLEAPWPAGVPAPYSFLAHALSSLSETRSRISIIDILTNTLRILLLHDPPSLLPALYLLSNTLGPPYLAVELGLGPSIISKAIQHVSGLTPAALKRLYNKSGDAGDVAFEAKSNLRTLVPHAPLEMSAVYDALIKISHSKGEGSAKRKQATVEKLLIAAKGEEVRYLVRTLSQNLRVGAVRTSILTALARAMVLSHPPVCVPKSPMESIYYASPTLLASVKPIPGDSRKKADDSSRAEVMQKFTAAESLVKRVYVQHPNYDHITAAMFRHGLEGLASQVSLTVGIPLHPTLGSPTRSLDEIYDRLENLPFTAELKYDGQRAQIHAHRTVEGVVRVKMFSRHLEDMTDKYPDVVSLVEVLFENSPSTSSFVVDSEIVAIDTSTGELKSFQELSNRARKDVKLQNVEVAVCVFAFDLMYHNGEALLEQPFRARRDRLRSSFPPTVPDLINAARFSHVESCESEDGREAVEEFWQQAVEGRSEGLMVKLLDSGEILDRGSITEGRARRKALPATYEPDKRTSAWLKLKKDYVSGLGDSLDLVPIGAWHGNGRKAQWWSPILLALWDGNAGQFVAVCKCMSGFSDEFYKGLRDRYAEGSEVCSRSPIWNCNTGGFKPEFYFKPHEVWEIRGADITLSPVSVAAMGLVSQIRGLSLRFPRFMRIRDDKSVEDATTPEFLAGLWKQQESRGKERGGVDDCELIDPVSESSLEDDDADE